MGIELEIFNYFCAVSCLDKYPNLVLVHLAEVGQRSLNCLQG